MDVDFSSWMFCSRENEGCAAGAWRNAKMTYALLNELIDDPFSLPH